jgi:dTMP kinase
MGKLIVIEGIDGSGKSTQFRLLRERFAEEKRDFRSITFPRYSEPSSALIKMYLGGVFGSDPSAVNAYAAGVFFAVDRYSSFHLDWKSYYNEGGTVITDRYTTSNAIHQAAKLSGEERREYFRWLRDFEYTLLGLPQPDLVLYLNIPASVATNRLKLRESESGLKGDIHESNRRYLENCVVCGAEASDYYGWLKIDCLRDGEPRDAAEIHREIYESLTKL